MDYGTIGFVRMGAAAPRVVLADPVANAKHILDAYQALADEGCSVALMPELALTGYSCEDLLCGANLIQSTEDTLVELANRTGACALVVGAPCRLPDSRLLNCAYVCANGKIWGAVPKSLLPNSGEFYDRRWFASGEGICTKVSAGGDSYWVDRRQLFQVGDIRIGIEVCEDLWAPHPTGVEHALAGAIVLLNPSASNELVGKAQYRRDLVRMQSAKCIAGYLYASAGLWESTKDLVFGGHLVACENGQLLVESKRLERFGMPIIVDFDCQKLEYQRTVNSGFQTARRTEPYRTITIGTPKPLTALRRLIDPHPFVPKSDPDFSDHAAEVLRIQTMGLLRRVLSTDCRKLLVGLSGGLDSTLALLVCHEVELELGEDNVEVLPITMPGPGTSEHTLQIVAELSRAMGLRLRSIPISKIVAQRLNELDHSGEHDTAFENVQARERTQILFDLANQEHGLVVGTGDMSELALGWCTFNADHMSSYNVNAGVPKTLVSSLIRWYAEARADSGLRTQLHRVLDIPISPELLPSKDGNIAQRTEEILGPYELHDFFLFQYLRAGGSVIRMYELAKIAFMDKYSAEYIRTCLRIFLERFYAQQFKRTTLPPGPKVGTVSLSPRGDWRMPDEGSVRSLLETIDAMDK